MTILKQNTYSFSSDWFSHSLHLFEKYLTQFKNKKVRFLEIGSYEGRSAVWMLENILTHPESSLTCVEPGNLNRNAVLKSNLQYFKNVTIINEKSQDAARKLLWEEPFDFIYVDGGHSKYDVYQDAVLSLAMLKTGGILAFDDYGWDKVVHDGTRPKEAIDKFIFNHPELRIAWKEYQVWFLK